MKTLAWDPREQPLFKPDNTGKNYWCDSIRHVLMFASWSLVSCSLWSALAPPCLDQMMSSGQRFSHCYTWKGEIHSAVLNSVPFLTYNEPSPILGYWIESLTTAEDASTVTKWLPIECTKPCWWSFSKFVLIGSNSTALLREPITWWNGLWVNRG